MNEDIDKAEKWLEHDELPNGACDAIGPLLDELRTLREAARRVIECGDRVQMYGAADRMRDNIEQMRKLLPPAPAPEAKP